ncbi:GalNAc-alpha-(1-_4)-GalNAc-alpha-(1-_3)-diNAcBac-PP-undecaprenol alpha-1,4-N-acetyl-D-galactosaminyltransferase [Streptomyces sp. RB5]|uniref:D-inositol 3-phosphate glycosyltransferase n=1 Tax=Streptomyces smaragdinus TaxID=2585196 RepID=A0A7K0CHJ5_9ACTN|nr:glycosyltransferase family 4 protein [Streptomyces smaragdinus]MQY12965.1 GalNAc-alpha-(1->4)-GalNAc-alpha-(1->3)-diNAcBac-PP-undecaprenol alpha-1,4-N-acetyl-D-galactosaminyltransferase [Streptomyces smaragdinus]
MKIVFLLNNAYALGGTVKAVFHLATALSDDHDVEIASLRRHRAKTTFALDPRVKLHPLVDDRKGSDDRADPLYASPSRRFTEADRTCRQYTALHDARAAAYLTDCGADVVLGTRAGINIHLAQYGPADAVLIGQEHLHHDGYGYRLWSRMARSYAALDAVVTTTEADAAAYRVGMPLAGAHVTSVPNIVPAPSTTPSRGSAKVIAAAGRFIPDKRHDLLLHAFARVARRHPDWELRIYGEGAERGRLEALVTELDLTGRVRLPGVLSPIEPAFAEASLVTVTSDVEPFGMTIVEAMGVGVPVVSTDCPLGPGEIIRDGHDGRLVPVGDAEALAAALSQLIEDEPARRAMGAAALDSARRYEPAPIAARYSDLFTDLAARRRGRRRPPGRTAYLRKAAPRFVRAAATRVRPS